MHADVIIIGAGAAGLMCAIEAGKRGRKVVVLERAKKPGSKILISGGGRCNFTNLNVQPHKFVSSNPHFCKSALSRFTSEDFIAMVRRHGIPFHEKELGQLFCDGSARDILNMLLKESGRAGGRILTKVVVVEVLKTADGFSVKTDQGDFEASSLVIASGGLSFPKIGATDLGYRLAEQFGLKIEQTAPALDGFRTDVPTLRAFHDLAGIACEVDITCGGVTFREDLLWTHFGLSGPAALQASLYWKPGEMVKVDLMPGRDAGQWLLDQKKAGSRMEMKNVLAIHFPKRLAERLTEHWWTETSPIHQVSDKSLTVFGEKLNRWEFVPAATMGYNRAEVTRGGVSTDELSSKTMESKKVPGLYFIGEVVDVTGWLGGYNFQWAWSSGWAAGQVC